MVNVKHKGRRGEQNVVKFWRDLFPEAHRHLEFREKEAVDGVDVILDEEHLIQVKLGSQIPKTNYKFINQMKENEDALQFVQMRRDYEDWLVLLKADEFKKIISRLNYLKHLESKEFKDEQD